MKISAKFIPCDCGGQAMRQFAPAKFEIGSRVESVENIPAFVCEKCGEIYYDGPSIVTIEKKLERKPVLA